MCSRWRPARAGESGERKGADLQHLHSASGFAANGVGLPQGTLFKPRGNLPWKAANSHVFQLFNILCFFETDNHLKNYPGAT